MAPIVQDGRGDDLSPVGHVYHCWDRHDYPRHNIPCLQRKDIRMAGASG